MAEAGCRSKGAERGALPAGEADQPVPKVDLSSGEIGLEGDGGERGSPPVEVGADPIELGQGGHRPFGTTLVVRHGGHVARLDRFPPGVKTLDNGTGPRVLRYGAGMADALAAGDRAPAFHLADQTGTKVRLSSFKGRKVLVYFYPKADTPGCTTQACGLRDIATDIGDTVILGVSPDAPEKLAKFDEKYGLGFTLLSDPDHATAEAYGAWGEKSMYGKKYQGVIRSAFLVGETGKVEAAWPKISPKDTPKNLLKALAAG